jgi:hypothetical protein
MSYEQLLHAYNAACAENQALRTVCHPDSFYAYNAACAENQALRAENQALRAECDAWKLQYDQASQQGNYEWCAAKTAAQAVQEDLTLTHAKLVLVEKDNQDKVEHIRNLNDKLMSSSLGADLMLTKAKLAELEQENENNLQHILNLHERLTQNSLQSLANDKGLRNEIIVLQTAVLTAKHESNNTIRYLQEELQNSARDLLRANQVKDEQKPTHKLADDVSDHSDEVSDNLSDEVSDNLSDEVSDDDNDFGTTENKLALCMYVVGYKNWHVSDDIQNTFSSVHDFVLMLIALWKTYFQ